MPISDSFHEYAAGLSSPVQGGYDITPADRVDLAEVTRALMVTGAGDLVHPAIWTGPAFHVSRAGHDSNDGLWGAGWGLFLG